MKEESGKIVHATLPMRLLESLLRETPERYIALPAELAVNLIKENPDVVRKYTKTRVVKELPESVGISMFSQRMFEQILEANEALLLERNPTKLMRMYDKIDKALTEKEVVDELIDATKENLAKCITNRSAAKTLMTSAKMMVEEKRTMLLTIMKTKAFYERIEGYLVNVEEGRNRHAFYRAMVKTICEYTGEEPPKWATDHGKRTGKGYIHPNAPTVMPPNDDAGPYPLWLRCGVFAFAA